MENLTLFEEEVLGILKQLEHCCDISKFSGSKPQGVKKIKYFEIDPDGINFSGLKSSEDIDAIQNYLWTKGLDFHYPRVENDNIYTQAQFDTKGGRFLIPLKLSPAIIKGVSIEAIKTKIVELINELRPKNTTQEAGKIPPTELQTKDKNEDKVASKNERPHCITEGSFGYLKFSKFGEKIKISRSGSLPFRLLQCLTEPLGVHKPLSTVYEAIRENIRGKSKAGVFTATPDKVRMLKTIEFSGIKELQKGNKLKGKLQFKFNDMKTVIWLEYTE